jgi:hypothetical protein
MREIRLYGSEGGGAGRSPYPYQFCLREISRLRRLLISCFRREALPVGP